MTRRAGRQGDADPRLLAKRKRSAEALRREVLGDFGRDRYSRAFERALGSFEGPGSFDELVVAATLADVIYVGDFHAVPEYQRFAAKLLEQVVARVGRLVLGVEFVHTRQQRLLDRRQRGELDDDTFLRRMRYRQEWGYPWGGFRHLLDVARKCDVPVHALDVGPRRGDGALRRRDEHAARRIASVLQRDPEAHMLVVFGESHMARRHLPGHVRRRLKAVGLERREVVVVQNPDRLYWKLVRADQGPPSTVRVDARTWAVFHTPPLEKYEACRQVLQRWRDDTAPGDDVDLSPAVHHLIHVLAGWLDIQPRRRRLHHSAGWSEEFVDAFPEVLAGREAAALLAPVIREQGGDADACDEARQRLRRRGAWYDPRSNTVFLTRYAPGPAGGESARFLRAALSGRLFSDVAGLDADPIAAAYDAAFEEALACLGSRLVDPTTVAIGPLSGSSIAVAAGSPADAPVPSGESAAWLERHRIFESSRRRRPPVDVSEPLARSLALRRLLARDLGLRLGEKLFARVRNGRLDAHGLRRLFQRRLSSGQVFPFVIGLLRKV